MKKSTGVTPEVILSNPLHRGEEARKQRFNPDFETWGRHYQKFKTRRGKFLHMSVILSTGRIGSLVPCLFEGSLSKGYLSREVSVCQVSIQGSLCQGDPPYGEEREVCILPDCFLVLRMIFTNIFWVAMWSIVPFEYYLYQGYSFVFIFFCSISQSYYFGTETNDQTNQNLISSSKRFHLLFRFNFTRVKILHFLVSAVHLSITLAFHARRIVLNLIWLLQWTQYCWHTYKKLWLRYCPFPRNR